MGIRIFGRISGNDNSYPTSGRKRFSVHVQEKESIFGPKISGDYSYLQPLEPHPEVFKVLELIKGSNYLYIVVQYPHCTNFEGKKVILMKDTEPNEILYTKILDPNFYTENKIIARFRPDEEGKKLAKQLAGINI